MCIPDGSPLIQLYSQWRGRATIIISAQKEGDKMARPAKSARVKTGTITKEEEAQRLELEDKLRGKNDKLVPPLYQIGRASCRERV